MKTFLSEKVEHAVNTTKQNNFHLPSGTTTRNSFVQLLAASSTAKYYVRDAWRPYYLLRIMQIATKQLVEQRQSIERIDSSKRR